MREAVHGVYQHETGFWVCAFDGGGRPLKTAHSFKSPERAELECLSMNKVKMLADGTIDDPMSKHSILSWREFFERRMAELIDILIKRKNEARA